MTYDTYVCQSLSKLKNNRGTLTLEFTDNHKFTNPLLEDLYTFYDIGVSVCYIRDIDNNDHLLSYFDVYTTTNLSSINIDAYTIIGIYNSGTMTNFEIIESWLKQGHHIRILNLQNSQDFLNPIYSLIPMSEKVTKISSIYKNLFLCFGPMFARKSTWLNDKLQQELNYFEAKVVKILSSYDVRKTTIVNHQGTTHHSGHIPLQNLEILTATNLSDLNNIDIGKYTAIGIDEGQFFKDIDIVVKYWLQQYPHIKIYISALDGDSNMKVFGNTVNLIDKAAVVLKRYAYCVECCKEDFTNILKHRASFTKRLIDNNDVICPGADDIYIPVCRYHFYNR